MFIYKVTQNVNNGYDTYDSIVVFATSSDHAKFIHPYKENWNGVEEDQHKEWANYNQVEVELLGEAPKGTKSGVIIASFNAG